MHRLLNYDFVLPHCYNHFFKYFYYKQYAIVEFMSHLLLVYSLGHSPLHFLTRLESQRVFIARAGVRVGITFIMPRVHRTTCTLTT